MVCWRTVIKRERLLLVHDAYPRRLLAVRIGPSTDALGKCEDEQLPAETVTIHVTRRPWGAPIHISYLFEIGLLYCRTIKSRKQTALTIWRQRFYVYKGFADLYWHQKYKCHIWKSSQDLRKQRVIERKRHIRRYYRKNNIWSRVILSSNDDFASCSIIW
jgi:hypothetical protein